MTFSILPATAAAAKPSESRLRRFELNAEQWVPRPLQEVFAFFGNADNLDQVTPPWLHFKILTPCPIDMHAGTLIEYSIRLRIVPMRWRTLITAWEPPFRFTDEQLKGPYALWRHEHAFTPERGGTLVRDRVTYALPFGRTPVAAFIHARLVRPDLTRVFAYRRAVIAKRFGIEP